MSSPNEDHREKNILLAKNLNQVKMDLRSKKKDVSELRSQLRMEKQRNSKLESDQVSVLQRIDFLKQQLDDTFYRNTIGYINLSKQLVQMHHESVQSFNETSRLSAELNVTFSTNNNDTAQSTFLDKIKGIGESMVSNSTSGDNELNISTLDSSVRSSSRQSLSFNTFSLGLNSTFANEPKEDDVESEMNCTFLEDSSEECSSTEMATPLTESKANRLNITMRRTKKQLQYDKSSKLNKKMVRNQLLGELENQAMATGLDKNQATDVLLLRRSKRLNESIRRKK